MTLMIGKFYVGQQVRPNDEAAGYYKYEGNDPPDYHNTDTNRREMRVGVIQQIDVNVGEEPGVGDQRISVHVRDQDGRWLTFAGQYLESAEYTIEEEPS